jgi:6-pyruvoyltetrahydropterin/6-carboxytetrahydropterin synthase
MSMELRKTFQFEAAHLLPRLPESHKCRRLHGHSFKVEVAIEGPCDAKLGLGDGLRRNGRGVPSDLGKLDHFYLNEIPVWKIRPAKTSPFGFGANSNRVCRC